MAVRRSVRLNNYDYSLEGAYFVTICTANRKLFFGEVLEDAVILNQYGKIARDEWIRTAEVRDNVEIDEFVIMPNHIHGIIIILPNSNSHGHMVENSVANTDNPMGLSHTPVARSIEPSPQTGQCDWPLHVMPKSPKNNLGAFIRGYKSAVTSAVLKLSDSKNSVWQRNYHEHIIRNEEDLSKVRNYIRRNPANWKDDKYHL